MADWPNIAAPSVSPDGEHYKGQILTPFYSGYQHSRAEHTRSREKFHLTWDLMPAADLATLRTFFDNNLGGTFNWTDPYTSTAYVMRFLQDRIPYVPVGPAGTAWYRVEVWLGEK